MAVAEGRQRTLQGQDGLISVEEVAALCSQVRAAVQCRTDCSVSVGAGPNFLIAKLAGVVAKPSEPFSTARAKDRPFEERRPGVCVVKSDITSVRDFVASLHLRDLPGVGRSSLEQLSKTQPPLQTCRDVQTRGVHALKALQDGLGNSCKAVLRVRNLEKAVGASACGVGGFGWCRISSRRAAVVDVFWLRSPTASRGA